MSKSVRESNLKVVEWPSCPLRRASFGRRMIRAVIETEHLI